MKNQKVIRLLCVLCWLGVATSGFLTGYMFYLARQFPEVDAFARNTYLAGALALLWLIAAAHFTAQARAGRKNGKK